jgi:hypothetical protein
MTFTYTILLVRYWLNYICYKLQRPKLRKTIAISLGWNCDAAVKGVQIGLRKRRIDGYKTCPFDAMISNYSGVVECILDNFKNFTNPDYLTLTVPAPDNPSENYIHNSYYKFYFNHETPGHANLHIDEAWSGGKNHFVENNFEKFRERYEQRIKNIQTYLTTPNVTILFLIAGYPGPYTELEEALKLRYPDLDYMLVYQPNYEHKLEAYNLYMKAKQVTESIN